VKITAIDSHAHLFTRHLPLSAERRYVPEHDATLAQYLALLDGHGVSHGVLVQPSFLGSDNSFLLDALRASPQRLRGVAVVEPSIGPDALQAMDQAGICGIRLNLVGVPLPDLHGSDWQRLLAQVNALGWHVELHRESRDLATAGQSLLDAGCRLVVDHFGRPGADVHGDPGFAWLLRQAGTAKVWVKLSAAYRNWQGNSTAPHDATQALLQHFGPERLVWGSDWPHTQHRDIVDYGAAHAALAAWVPDADARAQILCDTPAQLFKFKPVQ
jgi:predicted TIM-barrel fold metal-dependent hydrolase